MGFFFQCVASGTDPWCDSSHGPADCHASEPNLSLSQLILFGYCAVNHVLIPLAPCLHARTSLLKKGSHTWPYLGYMHASNQYQWMSKYQHWVHLDFFLSEPWSHSAFLPCPGATGEFKITRSLKSEAGIINITVDWLSLGFGMLVGQKDLIWRHFTKGHCDDILMFLNLCIENS